MTAWEGGEPVINDGLVGLSADLVGNEDALLDGIREASHSIFGDVGEIRHAAAQEVRSRFAVEILHGVCNHECRCKGQSKTHPSRIQFPELATPDQRFRDLFSRSWPRNEDQADEEDNDGGCEQTDEYEGSGGDCFFDGVGKGDIRVVEEEGTVIGFDKGEETAYYCDEADEVLATVFLMDLVTWKRT